jgi:methylation protein EvaC
MPSCRACGTSLEPFMTFGPMPIANGFVHPDKAQTDDYRFDLTPAVCTTCNLFQLMEQPDPEMMFHDEYAFFSQTSSHMAIHFEAFANDVINRWFSSRPDPFVVELGSNDGIVLKHFAAKNVRHLGVEPSANVAAAARKNGVDSLVEFFSEGVAKQIVEKHGQADALLAANVMCHISDIKSVAQGINILLKQDGLLIFEDPYLGEVLQKGSFDQIYDEHVFLFSLLSVTALFSSYNLEVVDVAPQSVHGGSMRYTLARPGVHSQSPSLKATLSLEDDLGMSDHKTYVEFSKRCKNTGRNLKQLLTNLSHEQKNVAGYGATSKSTTVLNYCGIGPDLIRYISDTTPTKQGKLTPGTHIPIRTYETFLSEYPDYAVLFAWNHEKEILAKESEYLARGGKFIRFFPTVEIIETDENS